MSSYKLQEIVSTIYDCLPKSVREFISPVVEPAFFFIKRVLFIASQIRLSVYLLQGKEKWGGSSLTTLFFGGLFFGEEKISYYSNLLYREDPIREGLGKVFIWKIKSKINSSIPKPDLIFIGVDEFFSRFLSREGFTIIPQWILFMLDLSKPLPETRKSSKNESLSSDLRRIRKYKYSYKMTRDSADFEHFYHHMYLPYLPKRFGKSTILSDFHSMKLIFEKGQLLLVKRGNEYISGNIIVMNNKSAFSACIAVKEGKMEYLKQGASAASYYFTILWAKERGYKSLDFGHCRPFLKDGVFCYKKKWSTEIRRSKRIRDVLGMKICNFSRGTHDFLTKNPFLFIDQDQLKGLILAEQGHPLTLEEIRSLSKTYHIPGLDCLVIVSPQGFMHQAEKFAASHPFQRLHLAHMEPDMFFKKFLHILSWGNCGGLGKELIKDDAK